MKRYGTHCDMEIRFFDTLEEAEAHANAEINTSRHEAFDGWDEELTEGIVVFQVIKAAQKVDPDADYRCVDYELADLPADETE